VFGSNKEQKSKKYFLQAYLSASSLHGKLSKMPSAIYYFAEIKLSRSNRTGENYESRTDGIK